MIIEFRRFHDGCYRVEPDIMYYLSMMFGVDL